ncbi:maltose/maltodextrin ABC transporter substrate-binding protein MalE [Haliangium ochraceum]|uniref:Extracellular solute-binding protein family 1 n=1 Tax=Haliangium ochraceum (strain DSM 14365 / JCM 11303 / SMP-2) TaxID=502025 RepID=D0LWI9_HALO1|nr:maltose/maltodextrin ABC transporter substrate-binding protein MalE [Haliangium ochraceum]ACY17639.1 extracellular solute-binding protein family 1 [Haliangium ochraceum DSM 14365]
MHRVLAKLGFITATAIAVLATSLGGQALADEQGTLTVWINGDKGYRGLEQIGKRFTKDTGVKVVVEHPEDAPGKFQQAAATGQGPDIFFWAHDRAGEWVQAGLIEPVKPDAKFARQFERMAWDAWKFGGKYYGYPVAIEAIALIYNTDLVKTPPKSFDQVVALNAQLSKQGKSAILWDYNNTYFTWPLLAANGGYVFKRQANGDYNAKDVGVNNAGALKGANLLLELIQKGIMPKGAAYETMEGKMLKGELGMMISGPWAWENLRKNKIPFSIAPIPSIAGKPARPFVGVLGAMINRSSSDKDLAREFLEKYVLNARGLDNINSAVPLGVPANKSYYRQLAKKDPLVKQTMLSAKNGMLMPSHPKMGSFWSAMQSALENITNQRQPPKQALDAAARRMAN